MMSARPLSPRRVLLASALGLALPAASFAECPPVDQVDKWIAKVFKDPAIKTKKVSPAALAGLCEVQVSFRGRPNVLYIDTTGAYFLAGHLFEIAAGKDLTEETLSILGSLSPEDLKKVDALVAMTVGTKGKPVYFVTDPQ